MTTTINMGLVLADVGITAGPAWASLLNAALEALDEHTHVSGDGVLIPSAGLNINGSVDWGANAITDLGSADLTDQASALTTGDRRIFAYGGELYYRDDAGNNVQITTGGAVSSAGTGNISGLVSPASAEFSALNGQFGWFWDTGAQASMQMGDIQIFPFDGAATYTNFWTVKSPTTLASNLTLTLPLALGATTLPLVGSSTGVLSFATGLQLGSGSASAVTYGFSTETGNNTGMYRVAEDTLGFSSGGTLRLSLTTTSLTNTLPFYAPSGAAATPSLTFSTDTDTGVYRHAADTLGLTTGGVARITISTTGLNVANNFAIVLDNNAGAATPALSFAGDLDTGMYWVSANKMGFATGGTVRATLNSGSFDANDLSTSGMEPFRVHIYDDVITAGADIEHTLVGRVVASAMGYYDTGAAALPMVNGSGGIGGVGFVVSTAVNAVKIHNFNASDRNFRLVILSIA